MNSSGEYDTDILQWSERQASALRELARRRRELSNELDWEHVAEEIEDVGRSGSVAAQSLLRRILIHVIKAISSPDSTSMLHWRSEVVGFHGDLLDRITPSMRTRLDLSNLWQQAVRQAEANLAVHGRSVAPSLPRQCPLPLEDILDPAFDFLQAVEVARKQIGGTSSTPPSPPATS